MKLTIESITNEADRWRGAGFILPEYDIRAVKANTLSAPEWVHFGPGNIFRGYIARLADDLIKSNDMNTGIIAANSSENESVDKIYAPYDDLALLVGLRAQGDKYLRVIGSIGRAIGAGNAALKEYKKIAAAPSLKMISFTITEKGYACTDINGEELPAAALDVKAGPSGEVETAMGIAAAMLYERFKNAALPIALVSMDNCSRNGDKLKAGVMHIINGWRAAGLVGEDFIAYVSDESKVAFPWSMIDKITPRPDAAVANELRTVGIEDMRPIVTSRGTFIAPFVNAEMPEYLVIEDSFPAGRPPLEKAGVYLTDRETVDRAEKMKVMTCLNPLHTALAVFGCLLGFKKISDEMNDGDLKDLVYKLGYKEGLPVVIDPKIIRPEDFLKEVLTERLPNTYLPDTPQRIATDTSQKIAIRFGETVKAYESRNEAQSLELIPLVLAAWLRYLTGIDDSGETMPLSADPLLDELKKTVKPEWFGSPSAVERNKAGLEAILKNRVIFGTDLINAGLSGKVLEYLSLMLAGRGAVRKTLKGALSKLN